MHKQCRRDYRLPTAFQRKRRGGEFVGCPNCKRPRKRPSYPQARENWSRQKSLSCMRIRAVSNQPSRPYCSQLNFRPDSIPALQAHQSVFHESNLATFSEGIRGRDCDYRATSLEGEKEVDKSRLMTGVVRNNLGWTQQEMCFADCDS